MRRLVGLARGRLRTDRALSTAQALQTLQADLRAAFVRCDWSDVGRLSEQLQAIDPRPPPSAEKLEAVREKFRALLLEAQARVEAERATVWSK